LISQPESLDPRQIANFAWFLAFQFTRGMANRGEMRVTFVDGPLKGQSDDSWPDDIEERLFREVTGFVDQQGNVTVGVVAASGEGHRYTTRMLRYRLGPDRQAHFEGEV